MSEVTTPADADEVAHLIELAIERWRVAGEVPGPDLLKLTISRDVVNQLHAQKSRFLSRGKKSEATSIRAYEAKFEEIRTASPLTASLDEILHRKSSLKKRTRLIPEPLYTAIPSEKFSRYDRQWEFAIAAEACQLGWSFWALDAQIEIRSIESWHKRLTERLWPSGVTLFIESGETPENEQNSVLNTSVWAGRWLVVMSPDSQPSERFSADMNQWTGTMNPVTWKLLFSPKNR